MKKVFFILTFLATLFFFSKVCYAPSRGGSIGGGDMEKAVYDTDNNSIVDKAEGLTENVVTETTIVDNTITETDLSFSPLNTDQTSPQEIVNGIPLLNTTPSGSPDIKSLVNKQYIDWAISSLGASYYMYRDTDATGYKTCYLNPSTNSETSIVASSLSDNDYIGGWISAIGEAPQKLLKGVYNWYITMERTGGNRTLRVYWKLYERTAGDTEIEIATSSYSNEITSRASYIVPLQLDSDYIPASDSRIVGKLYADVSGTGNAPELTIYFEGNTSSRWEIPANSEVFQNIFVPYDGATSNIDLGSKNLTTNGTINAGTLQVNSVDVLKVSDDISLLNNDAGYITDESDPVWSSEKSNYFDKTTDTTDDLSEGATNKFYSTSLFNTDFANKSIGDLSDVIINSPSDWQVLKYDNGKWGNQYVNLSELGDVFINFPSNEEVLKYDSGTGKWVNGTVSGGGQELYDCVVASDGSGDYTTLHDAIQNGETSIYIKDGTYTETNITLQLGGTKPITIIGESHNVIINSGTDGLFSVPSKTIVTYAGTVSFDLGSTTVTGNGTSFVSSGVKAGDYLYINNGDEANVPYDYLFKIKSVDNETQLTLYEPISWPGMNSMTNFNYEIRRISRAVVMKNLTLEGKLVKEEEDYNRVVAGWKIENCILNNFQFRPYNAVAQNNSVVNCSGRNVCIRLGKKAIVKGNRFVLSEVGVGIDVYSYSVVEGNTLFSPCNKTAIGVYGYTVVNNNTIFSGWDFTNMIYSTGSGIYTYNSARNIIISGNTIAGKEYGIQSDYTPYVIITGNSVRGCSKNGIISEGQYAVISGNIVKECGEMGSAESDMAGIYVGGLGSSVVGNVCEDNAGDGIYIGNRCSVVGNTCRNNGDKGIDGDTGYRGSVFIGNKVDNNTNNSNYTRNLPSSITVGSSPFTYQNNSGYDLIILISGGTVSSIEFSRDNSNWYDVGQTSGMFILPDGDYLKITYTEAPTMTAIQR